MKKVIGMTRKEFEEYKKSNKYIDKPFEYYRVLPLLNKNKEKLIVFARENKNGISILKKAIELLEEETSTQK